VGYLANKWDVPTLLSVFLGGWVVILGATLAVTSRISPHMKGSDKAILLWFVLTGFIHSFFEGYFVLHHTQMAPSQTFFGQLWKEYSMSDSRYLTSDPFVLCMETITSVCWGPLSFLVAYLITVGSPLRHPLQALVSLGQIYGDVLYYATSLFDHYHKGLTYYRPEPYYFWFYFVFMNAIWIVIPGFLLYQSIAASSRAFQAADKLEASRTKMANGSAKKSH